MIDMKSAAQNVDLLLREFSQLSDTLDSVRKLGIAEACEVFRGLKELNDKYSETGKLLSAAIEVLKHNIIPEKFESSKVSSFTTTTGYRVGISMLTRASMTDKEGGKQWLRDNGLGDLITETVNASTLSATAKSLLEEGGKELDPQFFKTSIVPTTSVTRVS